MTTVIYRFLFFIFSIYFLAKVIFYALFEINSQNNKSGGIGLIFFSILVTIFSNIVVLIRG